MIQIEQGDLTDTHVETTELRASNIFSASCQATELKLFGPPDFDFGHDCAQLGHKERVRRQVAHVVIVRERRHKRRAPQAWIAHTTHQNTARTPVYQFIAHLRTRRSIHAAYLLHFTTLMCNKNVLPTTICISSALKRT